MNTPESLRVSAIESRVRQFYQCLSEGRFRECYQMIDPAIREDPHSVTLYQYMKSREDFLGYHGKVEVLKVELRLHANETSARFQNRDFAIGKTTWKDRHGQEQVFLERWVKNGGDWYTVCTGFVTPDREKVAQTDVLSQAIGVSRKVL